MQTQGIKEKRNVLKHFLSKTVGFTLVELIIVITILAILATIAFISFQNFTKNSRDGKRFTEVKTIENGLELLVIKTTKYPEPDGKITQLIGTEEIVLVKKGVIGEQIAKSIGLNTLPKDPSNGDYYVYGITGDGKKFQVATFNETDLLGNIPFISQVYANTQNKAVVKGNYTPQIIIAGGYKYFVPSLIFNYDITGEAIEKGENFSNIRLDKIEDTSSKIFYVMNDDKNLPYKPNNNTEINNVENTNLTYIQELAKKISGEDKSYTGDNFEELFVGMNENSEIIKAVEEVTSTQNQTQINDKKSCENIPHGGKKTFWSEDEINKFALYTCSDKEIQKTCNNGNWEGDEAYSFSSCIKGEIYHCEAQNITLDNNHTYSIPLINHGSGASNILSSDVEENNGTFQYTLTNIICNDGELKDIIENENPTVKSCDENFGINGNTCSPSQNGSCNNTVALGCNVGSYINDNGQTSCGTTRTWSCSGLYGGNVSNQCNFTNPSCQSNPTNLSLNHTTRNKTFTFSWAGGVGNGNCKLQYNKNGTWTNISETTYNCDNNIANQTVTLPGDNWYSGNWNGLQIRIMRVSDSQTLGTFPQTLICSSTSGSSSSTPNIDEDCNGVWNNYTYYENYYQSGTNPCGSYGAPRCKQTCTEYGKTYCCHEVRDCVATPIYDYYYVYTYF